MKSLTWFVLFFLIPGLRNEVKAQLFKLDSVVQELVELDSIYLFLQKNANGKNLPIFVDDKSFITLFGLSDTTFGGIQFDYFVSKEDIIKRYKLKRDNRSFLFVSLSLHEVTENSLQVSSVPVGWGGGRC